MATDIKNQYLISDLCSNCNNTLIYAEYYNGNNLTNRKYQILAKEVNNDQKEKYQNMLRSDRPICKCDNPFPDLFKTYL